MLNLPITLLFLFLLKFTSLLLLPLMAHGLTQRPVAERNYTWLLVLFHITIYLWYLTPVTSLYLSFSLSLSLLLSLSLSLYLSLSLVCYHL